MPKVSCSGVWLADSSSGTCRSCWTNRFAFSNVDRAPYSLTGAPSARGSRASESGRYFERQATSAALHAAPNEKKRERKRRREASSRERLGSMRGIMRYDERLNHPQES